MEGLLYSYGEYKIIVAALGFLVIAIETFIPMLPLVAIVLANVFILGTWLGFLVSWLGSVFASILLYLLARKFFNFSLFTKFKEKKNVNKFILWIKKQGFNTIFICYTCPFIPDFIITVTSGLTQFRFKPFLLGMMSGKFIMFLIIAYLGNDIEYIYKDPVKIIVISALIIVSWFVGKKLNDKIENE